MDRIRGALREVGRRLTALVAARLPSGPAVRLPAWLVRSAAPLTIGAVTFGMVATVGMVQVTSTPDFCNSCHNMKPYYQSWKHSKHTGIACVECHISPGLEAEVQKKFEALSMVAKYFTGTEGTKPWGEVDDAACLRCHERSLLTGRKDFKAAGFDHRPHLAESRNGLQLRCTSCHTQLERGEHIAVASSTCALCHFKNQPVNAGAGACLTCHEVPEKVTTRAGVTFDHRQVTKLGMACDRCHGNVVRGDGAVPRERCLTCHNDREHLERIDDMPYLHEQHVSVNKVDCQHCHLTIEHGKAPAAVATHTSPPAHDGGSRPDAGGDCRGCHGSGHSPQQDLYAGVGGRGVPPMPSAMYVTGVTCQGCHDEGAGREHAALAAATEGGPVVPRASAASCMSCHGPGYGKLHQAWRTSIATRVGALKGQLQASAAVMGVDAPAAWDDARANFLLVERGRGVHNMNFAFALLDKSFEQMNEARKARGLGALERPWRHIPGGGGACLSCHTDIEGRTATFAGQTFRHGSHLGRAQLACADCHRTHAEKAPHEIVRFGPDGCQSCHHRDARAVTASACASCHGDVMRKAASGPGRFSHREHDDAGLECRECHSLANGDPRPPQSACRECHDSGVLKRRVTDATPGATHALAQAHARP